MLVAVTLCLSACVRMSVQNQCSIERDGQIKLVFGKETTFDQSYTVL